MRLLANRAFPSQFSYGDHCCYLLSDYSYLFSNRIAIIIYLIEVPSIRRMAFGLHFVLGMLWRTLQTLDILFDMGSVTTYIELVDQIY
jgi:hypothetical protein